MNVVSFFFLNRPSNQQWKRVVTWYVAHQLKVLPWHYFSPCSVLFSFMFCCALAFTRLTQKQKTKKWTHRQDELWVRCRREWYWMQCPLTTWWQTWWPYHSPPQSVECSPIKPYLHWWERWAEVTNRRLSSKPPPKLRSATIWDVVCASPCTLQVFSRSPKLKRSRCPAVPQT